MSSDDWDQNDYLDLPVDAERGFIHLYQRQRRWLDDKLSEENIQHWRYEQAFTDTLLAYDDVHDLRLFSNLGSPPDGDENFPGYYRIFSRRAMIVVES